MKIDRLLGILTTLLQRDRVTAPYLAEKFEVNRRTIGRDIDALCRAGIPIVTHQGVGGGISIAEGYRLDKSVLTSDELSNIIAALKGIGSVSETSQIERALDKLGANAVVSMCEPIVIDLASFHKENLTQKIGLLKKAVREGLLVEFDYYYEKGMSRRRIEPYFVIFQWGTWYAFGFCIERLDFRLFKLGRLWEIVVCEERFSPREIPAEKRDFDRFIPDDKRLVALFDPREQYRLIETYGPDSYTETADGLLLEIRFTHRDYVVTWLLGFGGNVKVLEPADVAEEIKAAAENILSLYN